MNCLLIKDFLETSFSSFFTCSQKGDFLAIMTPFHFPDGDVIEVYLHERMDKLVLSDLGETLRYLGSYDLDIKSYSKRETIIEDVTKLHRVKFFKGTFYKHVPSMESLAESIFDLSQCIIRVCDLLYTVRGSSPAAFVEEVKDFLDINKYKFEENFSVETSTDNKYEFDFGVEVGDKIKLIKLLNPPAKPTHKPNIDRIVRTWLEVNLYSEYNSVDQRISLLDDTNYFWKDQSILLVQNLSSVARWTDKEGFKHLIDKQIA